MSSVLWLWFGPWAGLFVMRDGTLRRPMIDLVGLEALDYWTHLCDRARRKTDARLFVSNEYLS